MQRLLSGLGCLVFILVAVFLFTYRERLEWLEEVPERLHGEWLVVGRVDEDYQPVVAIRMGPNEIELEGNDEDGQVTHYWYPVLDVSLVHHGRPERSGKVVIFGGEEESKAARYRVQIAYSMTEMIYVSEMVDLGAEEPALYHLGRFVRLRPPA